MQNEYKALYEKYLKGHCTPDEIELLQTYFAELQNADELRDVEELMQQYKERIVLSEERSDAILNNIYAQDLAQKKVRLRRLYKWSAVASLFLVGFLLWQQYFNASVFSERVYVNHGHTTKQIILEDSSTVYLKPSSRVVQRSDFSTDDKRIVFVQGEAFFAVRHKSEQPFEVQTDREFAVRVLGTRFNIVATENLREVVLTEGSVRLFNEHEQVTLKPSQRAVYSQDISRFKTTHVDTLLYNAWIDNLLYFSGHRLRDVIYQLNKNYANEKQELIIPTHASDLQFTGYLPTDNLDKCVTILNKTFANHQIIIQKNEK